MLQLLHLVNTGQVVIRVTQPLQCTRTFLGLPVPKLGQSEANWDGWSPLWAAHEEGRRRSTLPLYHLLPSLPTLCQMHMAFLLFLKAARPSPTLGPLHEVFPSPRALVHLYMADSLLCFLDDFPDNCLKVSGPQGLSVIVSCFPFFFFKNKGESMSWGGDSGEGEAGSPLSTLVSLVIGWVGGGLPRGAGIFMRSWRGCSQHPGPWGHQALGVSLYH